MQPEIFLSVPLHGHAATPGQVKASEGAEEMDFGRVFARQSADEMRRETPKTVAAPMDKPPSIAEGEAEDAEVFADEDTPPDEAEAVPDETAQPERPAPGLTADVKGQTGEPAAMARAELGHADSGHGDATSMGPVKAQGVVRFGADQKDTAQESRFAPEKFASELLGERKAEVPYAVSLETPDTIGASHARTELLAGQAPMVAPPGPRRQAEAGNSKPGIDEAMYRNRIGPGATRESATHAGKFDFINSRAPESNSGFSRQPEITTTDSRLHAGPTYDRAQPLEIAGVEPEAGADHPGRPPAEMAAVPTARRVPTSARRDMPESPESPWPFPASQIRGAFAGMENSPMNPRYEGHTVRGEQVVQDHDRLIGTVVSPPRTERKGLASTMQTATSAGISDSAINPATWLPVPADAVSAGLSTIPAPGGHELRFSPTDVDLPAMTAVPVASSRLSEGLNVAASEEPDFRPGLTRHAVPTQATLNTAEGSEVQFSEPARTRLGTVQLSEDAVRQPSASLADRNPLSGVNSSVHRSDPAQFRLAATDATEQKAGMRKVEPEGQRVVLSDRDRFGLVWGQNGAQSIRSFENAPFASLDALRNAGAGDGTEAFLMAGREQAPEVTSVIGRPDAGQVRVGATGAIHDKEGTAKTGPERPNVMPAGGNSFGVKTGQSGSFPIHLVETAPPLELAAARNAGTVAGTTPPAIVTTREPAIETSGQIAVNPGTKVPSLSLSDSGGVTIPVAVTTVRGSELAAQPFADPTDGQPAEMARVLAPTHDRLRPPQPAGAGPAEDVGNPRVRTSAFETHETGRDRRLGPAEIGSHGYGPRNVTATDAERLSSEPGLMEQQLSARGSETPARDEGAERWLGGRETARSRPSPAPGVGEPSPLASTRAEEPGHSRHPDRLDAGRALPPETASPQMARRDAVTRPSPPSTEIPQAQDGAVNKTVSAPADLVMPRSVPETMGHVPRDMPLVADPQAPPAQHAALARDVAQQLSQVTRSLPGEVTELTLRPEELGQVRMRLSGSDGQIVLQILSERPETHDLMRRHIEIVERAFRDLGYQDIAFDFSFSGQRGREPQSPRESTAPEDRQIAELPPATRAARDQMLVPGRLDIRL